MRKPTWLSSLFPVSFEEQCRQLLNGGALPCFSLRWTGEYKDDIFLVTRVQEDGSFEGYTWKTLSSPTSGKIVMRRRHVDWLKLVPTRSVIPDNGVDMDKVWRVVNTLAGTLKHDQRAIIFTDVEGTEYWIGAEPNRNHHGFSAEKPLYHNGERQVNNEGVFFNWRILSCYQGTFHEEPEIRPVENFVYYSWMGSNVTAERWAELQKTKHVDLYSRLQKNLEERRALDAALADIIRLMRHDHVHLKH